jgi:3-methyl-2-oxobutanoate hydroxymethyltransferase
MNILDFRKKKLQHEKIAMLTCYDYTSARLLRETQVDCLLVGDSAAMTMHGFANTLAASIEMMAWHTAAVAKGAPNKFIVGDLPFLSYRQSLNENIAAVKILMQAGAHAVKLEGAAGNLDLIKHLVESGVPVMGHLGLTPQAVHALGGFKVQGKTLDAEQQLMQDAKNLQTSGCFALVLECVPSALARTITENLDIVTIGIGAGPDTDGQVLVFQDLLGLNTEFKPKFVKHFVNGAEVLTQGIEAFITEVKQGVFPQHEHSY